MYDNSTHLLLARSEQRERQSLVASENRALRLARLRRLDRRAHSAEARARLLRLALS